jgi:hypothetical protein
VLDVLLWELKASSVTLTSFMEAFLIPKTFNFFQAVNFFQFFS